jgi:hypothetical protein
MTLTLHDKPKAPPREIERIISLPIAPRLTDAEREEVSKRAVEARAYNGRCACEKCRGRPFRLFAAQADGLHAYEQATGGFFNIRVGGGKTGLCCLIASDFYRKTGGKILLLIEPGLFQQFTWRDLPWARQHLSIALPTGGFLGNQPQKKRLTIVRANLPGLFVVPYSLLSVEDTQELLHTIDADLVIADEAQNLSGDSAKTKRFWAWIEDRQRAERPVKGVAMSGTLTSRSPMDYHRLLRWCLGNNSPLPRPVVEAVNWAKMLSSGATDPPAGLVDDIGPLLRWAEPRLARPLTGTVPDIRAAYKERLHTAPGFVTSGDGQLGVGLEIKNEPADTDVPDFSRLEGMVKALEKDWRGPNGDVLTFGIEIHNAMRELSAGFYNRRFWDETHPLVEQAKARFAVEQEYNKALNDFFRSTRKPRPGLDTPMLVGKHHEIHGAVPGWSQADELYRLWTAWKGLDSPDLPERQSEPVRVCDYKVRHAVEWATRVRKSSRSVRGGILWCYHTGVALWLKEALESVGLPVLMKGGGATWLENDGSENYFCIASIEAHHAGKNLQHHRNQLAVQMPRPADYVEQMLGRCHRQGQQADRLVFTTNLTLDWDHEQLSSTLSDTVYQKETLGGDYKLLIADWNPPPKKHEDDFLRARGWKV